MLLIHLLYDLSMMTFTRCAFVKFRLFHLSTQTAAAHAKRLQAFEELVPQPAVSAVKCSQLSSNGKYGDSAASTRAPGDTSRVTRKRSVEDELLSKVAEEIFASSFRNSDNVHVTGEVNDTERAPEDLLWIDDEVATHATAAAKLMRSAFGDPVKNRADGSGKRDFKGVGERVAKVFVFNHLEHSALS